MKRNLGCFAVLTAMLFTFSCAYASPTSRQEIESVHYLVGTWNCAHTVGTFSGAYTTTYSYALDNLWLKQTYNFPPKQLAPTAVQAEYFMGYDEQRQGWVRFGAMSTGQYFAIRMTDTGSGWAWKYKTLFQTARPETPGSDATFTKKSDSEYTVDGPTYKQDGTGPTVTEHHICKKV